MSEIVEMFKQKFSEIVGKLNEYIDKTDKENIDFSHITSNLSSVDEITEGLSLPHSANDRAEMLSYWESENTKVLKKYEDKIKTQ